MPRPGQNFRRRGCGAGSPLSGPLGPVVVAGGVWGVQVGSRGGESSGAGLRSGQDGFISLVRFLSGYIRS